MAAQCRHAIIHITGLLAATWMLAFSAHAESPQAAPSSAITLHDMLGNPVVLQAPLQRVVTIPIPASSLHMSLDGGPARLAGMNLRAYSWMKEGVLQRIYPNALQVRSDITHTGFAPNVENLLQIQPDLIWQWGHMGDNLIAPLRNAGLPVAALLYGTEERTRQWLQKMGEALQQQPGAQAQLQWRQAVEQQIRQALGSIAPNGRPGVLYLSRYQPQPIAAGSSGNFHWDIELAGGRNVAVDLPSNQTVNMEQILAWNPDVILLNNFEVELSPQALYKNPLLAEVSAIRQRRVYKIPAGGFPWDPPSQESPLYWQWLSTLLHPGTVRFAPLRDEISKAFQNLYGYTPTPADVDQVLHVSVNRQSRGYAVWEGVIPPSASLENTLPLTKPTNHTP